MKELIKTNVEQDTKEGKLLVYAMMNGTDTVPMKDVVDGTPIEIKDYCIYHLTKDDGEEMNCSVIRDAQGVMYATRSESVKKHLEDLISIFDGDLNGIAIKKVSGKATSGNTFVSIDPVL